MLNKTLLFVSFALLIPCTSYSEESASSFLLDEIKMRTSGGSSIKSRSSSIVDFLKKSDSEMEAITKTSDVTDTIISGNKKIEVKVKKEKKNVLSSESSRVQQIASTGTYRKSYDPKLVTKTSIKKRRISNKISYCLGGDYKDLTAKAKNYEKFIVMYGKEYGVSSSLIKAVITAESCFNERALSPKGAQGLMQLMPGTATRFGISNSYNPDANIKGGTRYLKFLMGYFKNNLPKVIAAYNAGEGAVDKYKGIPPYKETKNYVKKVTNLYKLFNQGKGDISTLAAVSLVSPAKVQKVIFTPRAIPVSRFSPYKNRQRNISRGNCANKTSTRLRRSTLVESGNGVWQRIYVAKRGQTLLRVMQATGIHKSKIAQMNGLSSRAKLKSGQRLLVWECRK